MKVNQQQRSVVAVGARDIQGSSLENIQAIGNSRSPARVPESGSLQLTQPASNNIRTFLTLGAGALFIATMIAGAAIASPALIGLGIVGALILFAVTPMLSLPQIYSDR